MSHRAVIDLRPCVDAMGQLDPSAARHAIARLEWDAGLARSGRVNVLIRVPHDRRTHPGSFLSDLAHGVRCYPRVIFEGDPATVRDWEARYHRLAAGVTLLDLVTFVDSATGVMDEADAAGWLRSELVHRRLIEARSVAVDLPEWRTLPPSPLVLDALAGAAARARALRSAMLPIRFYGLSAPAWAAYRPETAVTQP